VTVLGFLGQSEDGAARVGAVGNLTDLVRLLAPGAPDLQERGAQHENLTASGALDLGPFPVDLHYVILNNPVIAGGGFHLPATGLVSCFRASGPLGIRPKNFGSIA